MSAPQPTPAAADGGPSIDQSLAEMAHKLEAALRKPKAERAAAPSAEAAPAAEATTTAPAAPVPPAPAARGNRAAESSPARNDAKQPNPGKTLYDNLEQEMASLLGRPSAKN